MLIREHSKTKFENFNYFFFLSFAFSKIINYYYYCVLQVIPSHQHHSEQFDKSIVTWVWKIFPIKIKIQGIPFVNEIHLDRQHLLWDVELTSILVYFVFLNLFCFFLLFLFLRFSKNSKIIRIKIQSQIKLFPISLKSLLKW